MKTKYIVMKDEHGKELLFTFPEMIAHNWMFEAVQNVREGVPQNWARPYRGSDCVAAGFMTKDGVCYGRSESLNIPSRPEIDTKLFLSGSFQ
jgi:hypothetical protein